MRIVKRIVGVGNDRVGFYFNMEDDTKERISDGTIMRLLNSIYQDMEIVVEE